MRRPREQMLAELLAKIAEDKKRGEARDLAKAITSALIKRDYDTSNMLAIDLLRLTAELQHDTRGMDHIDQRQQADGMEVQGDLPV